MKLTRCENKHYYDADAYDDCPHCKSSPTKAATPKPRGNTISPYTVSIFDELDENKTVGLFEDLSVKTESLEAQVKSVTSPISTDDVKTIAIYGDADSEPVVGWLVCVSGEYFGQSFNLHEGQNFIGRALNMDVALAKDTSVSRNKHAVITFDPQASEFFIQPGESSGITYFNGSALLAPSPIKNFDKIKVGNSEFIFIPLCCEKFSWKDFKK